MSTVAVPHVATELLRAHGDAHDELARRFAAADPGVQLVFKHLHKRLTMEGLAHVQSVRPDPARQLLLPAPRAFLTRAQQLRLRGAETVFRHVDTRVALEQSGAVPCALDSTTLPALHALWEGADPRGAETNPGMYRLTQVSWQMDTNPYLPPPATEVPGLVAEALEVAADRSHPAVVRAAWLTFVLLAIHPFVDGNGRTCRTAYLLVASPDLPLGFDWGISEQWSTSRNLHVETQRRGNPVSGFEVDRMTAEPFATYSTAASIRGVEICLQRLAELARVHDARSTVGWSEHAATIAGVIRSQRSCTWDELLTTGLPVAQLDEAVAELLDRRAARWAPRPPSRRTIDDPAPFALVLT